MIRMFAGALCALLVLPLVAAGHPGHVHKNTESDQVALQEQKSMQEADPFAVVPIFIPEKKKDNDGQGAYRFRYVPEMSKLPVHGKTLLDAHGGFGKDAETGETTFGLPGVGLLRLSPDLKDVKVVGGKGFDVNHNPHNTHVFTLNGEKRIAIPSDSAGKVFLTDYDGALVKELGPPPGSAFKPTDAVIASVEKKPTLFVPSGYGDRVVYAADPVEGAWTGLKWGGKPLFSTSHGIVVNPLTQNLVVANREDGQLLEFTPAGKLRWMLNFDNVPNPCDVDFSEDGTLAVVGCLHGPRGGNAVFYILKDGVPVSRVCPADLGVVNSRHIHNAVLRFVKQPDGHMKLYVICYFWKPGGYGVFEHVDDV